MWSYMASFGVTSDDSVIRHKIGVGFVQTCLDYDDVQGMDSGLNTTAIMADGA